MRGHRQFEVVAMVLGTAVVVAACSSSDPSQSETAGDEVTSALPGGGFGGGGGGGGGLTCNDVCDGVCAVVRLGTRICTCSGPCADGKTCTSGRCVVKACVPSCDASTCGLDDGCGHTCACSTNPASGPNQFVFTSNGQLLQRTYVFPYISAEQVLYPQDNLGGVAGRCVHDIQVSYQRGALGGAVNSEIDLFGRDPEQTLTDLAALGDADIKAGAWSQQTWQPYDAPDIVAVPYPSNGSADANQPVTLSLSSSNFWPTGVDTSTPAVRAASTCENTHRQYENTGTIKAVAVHQLGLCARSVDLTDTLGKITDGVWNGIASSGSLSNPVNQYLKAFAGIGRSDPGNPNDVRAQFLMALHFSADVAGVGNEVWGAYKYQFGLSNGFLVIDSAQKIRMDDSGIWGSLIAGRVDSKLANDVVSQFDDTAHAKQRFSHAIFGGCSAVADCASSANALAQLVTPITMANAGIPNATQDQINHVRCALADADSCAAISRTPNLAAAWECPAPADSQQQVCSFALHARRLNAMPDELQLVWFDARDIDDPNFALFVAGGQAASSQMCTATPRSVSQPPSYYARGFAAVGYGL